MGKAFPSRIAIASAGLCLMVSIAAIPARAQITPTGTTIESPGSTGTMASGTVNGSVWIGDFGPGTTAGALTIDGATLNVNQFDTPVINPDGASFDGARVHVGLAGPGGLTLTNGALLRIDGGTSLNGGGLAVSNRPGDLDHGLSAAGSVLIDNSRIEITGLDNAGGTVGRDGVGTMTIQNGGTLEVIDAGGSSYGFSIGQGTALSNAPGTGTVTVTGAGSQLRTVNLNIGRDTIGTGTLTVENGGSAVAIQGIRVGRDGGDGTLNINAGGLVSSGNGSGSIFLGSNTGVAGGNALMVMTGGTLNAGTGSLFVAHGEGTSSVADVSGGTINAPLISIGHGEQTNGNLTVNGATTAINILGLRSTGDGATLLVGRDGLGLLNLNNGRITLDSQVAPTGLSGGLVLGGSSTALTNDGAGTVNISGAGVMELRTGVTQIGRQGTGLLNITGGGTLDASLQETSVIGRLAGSTGTVNVSGTGSTWSAGTRLFIGTDVDFNTNTALGNGGTGLLNVANGGAVFANDLINGATGTITGGGGTITANIQNSGTIGPGNSPGLMSVIGDVNLLAGGTLVLELGGIIVDTGYDRLDVAGTAILEAGSIYDIDFFGGFTAGLGDVFDVLVADNISVVDLGALIFDFNGALLGTGLAWQTSIVEGARDTLRLSVVAAEVAVSEPSTLPLFATLLFAAIGIGRAKQRKAG